ncbi:putative Kinase-like domain-containing protein [Seiridium unicorne]|uniref:non-specific serine/threonine protein kinase n=1 Tax=Seiridium unicorne TaxID=138068 RepID=A0ABR2V4T8_9PEZI
MASPASSDEGEIIETGVGAGDSKATPLPQINGNGVDRPDRNRFRYSKSKSPEYEAGSRYSQNSSSRRSRSPRGFKRSRNDNDYSRGGRLNGDPRQFRVHYEDARDSRRSHYSYDDDDRPPSRSSTSGFRYDERDRARDYDRSRDHSRERDRDEYPDKRARNRTRSPYRPSQNGRDRGDRGRRDADRPKRTSERDREMYSKNNRQDNLRHDARQATLVERNGASRYDTKSTKANSGMPATDSVSEQSSNYDQDVPEEQPIDEAAEIERRKRRREELLAKTRGPAPMLVQALQGAEKAALASPAHTQQSTPLATEANTPRSSRSISGSTGPNEANSRVAVSSPSSPTRGMQEGMSPAALDITNDQDLINTHGQLRDGDDDDDGPSAADYDPTADMREDEKRDELRHGQIGPHGDILPSDQKAEIAPKEEPQPNKSTEEDDDFDMFAEDFDEDKFAAPKAIVQPEAIADDGQVPGGLAQPVAGGILDGDDKDGYYKIRIGEIMNGRYQVQATLGKGMFSGVARAVDITTKQLVAIKMMRNNDALRKGGFTEIAILQKLNDSDPENRKHIVKFERHFEHKGHLCLAFENLSLNLREVLKKFGNNVGINLSATRSYAHQMFVALAQMRKCTIIHADIKPDNILVNEARNILKICDLGTAIDKSDAATAHNEITPYLVSRFYRAPEIILGLPYDYAVDMWSIGCTLYELYTGKILFTGDSNNQMLKTIMEIRGKFSTKLYKRGQLWQMHFDDMGNFISVERDKMLDKTNIRTLAIVKPTRDLRARLTAASGGMNDAETRDLNHFTDLLERCLALNPDKRITPSEALKHPFFLRAFSR